LNPLGVDVEQFPSRRAMPTAAESTVLFVGQWSYRKGVDVLTRAIETIADVRLIHVGALSDAPFPNHPRFIHRDHVPQQKLKEFYRIAHVLVLPSREDGFGVVLSQALSSGLQVVCTNRTGGPDLAQLPGLARLIRIVPPDDSQALAAALALAIDDAKGKSGVPPIKDSERQLLGWRCHAERDLAFMRKALRAVGHGYCE
jgi:glycosyltransferase involved in cell wall biosynthesis